MEGVLKQKPDKNSKNQCRFIKRLLKLIYGKGTEELDGHKKSGRVKIYEGI